MIKLTHGMSYYIHFFHGRTLPDDQLDDWGFEGPLVGPIAFITCTYGILTLHTDEDAHGMVTRDGLVIIDGKCYGDYEILDDEAIARPQYNGLSLMLFSDFINLNR